MKLNFFKRFLYYLSGFGLGLILVFFFFKNRGCSWLPDNRVKNIISERVLICDSLTLIKLKEMNIDADLISAIDKADINYSKSKKKGSPKVYSLNLCDYKKSSDCKEEFHFLLHENSFFCQVYSSKKNINERKQHIKNKHVLSIPQKGYYKPIITNFEKIKKDMAIKGLNNLTDFNKLMKHRYSDILIDTSDCYNFIVYLDSLNYKTSLNFYADKESVVLKKIEKQDTINDN